MYLAVSKEAVCLALVRQNDGAQTPVYYVSKRLLDVELRYPKLELLTHTLIISTRKLHHYILAHPVIVFTNHPMKQGLHRPEASGRLVKWAVKLTHFNIFYQPHISVKVQSLADFIAEFTFPSNEDRDRQMEPLKWKLYVDGSSNENPQERDSC